MRLSTLYFVLCGTTLFFSGSTGRALDIQLTFDAAGSLPEDFPAFDPDASLLAGIVEYAASVYEDIIEANHVLELTYRWDKSLAEDNKELNIRTGLHTYFAEEDGRETSGRILFDPDPDWYIDPTPADDSEFAMAPVLFRDLTAAQQANRFGGDVPDTFEAGFRGDALATAPADAQNNFDLLTIVFHEMGHALGMSGSLSTLLNETADGDYDIRGFFVGNRTMQQFVRNTDTPNNRAHLVGFGNSVPAGEVPGPSVMSFVGRGERRRPSAADLFAMDTSSLWIQLDLRRLQFLGGSLWHDQLNWLGGFLPNGNDDVSVRTGDAVLLSDDAFASVLRVDDGSTIFTGGHLMWAIDQAFVGGTGQGEVVVGGLFGPVAGGTFHGNLLTVASQGTVRMNGGQASGDEAVVSFADAELSGTIATNINTRGLWNPDTQVVDDAVVSIGSGGHLSWNGNITGSGNLTKTGGGTLLLDGSNGAWMGHLIIDDGTVIVAPGNGLSNQNIVDLRGTNSVINFVPEAEIFGGLTGVGRVIVGPGNIQFGHNDLDSTFTGTIETQFGSTGGFANAGTGTTTFAGNARVVDVSIVRSRDGGTIVFTDTSLVTTDLIDAIDGSAIRIEGDATVFATAGEFANQGQLDLVGGTLITTAFNGLLLNQGGTLSPGTLADETRVLPIADNFNNDANSTLQIDVGGLLPGQHDQLDLPTGIPGIGKFAGLGGTLDVNLVDGFVPNLGDQFTVIEARSIGGAFHVVDAPIFNGLTFDVAIVDLGANVMQLVLEVIAAPAIAGDYNGDGTVNAGDYTVWRDNLGLAVTLPGDTTTGTVTQADYDVWRANFGATAASSAGPTLPEPATVLIAVLTGLAVAGTRARPGPLHCTITSRPAQSSTPWQVPEPM